VTGALNATVRRWRVIALIAVVVVAIAVPVVLLETRKETMTGVVVRVDTVSLTDVRSFDLRTSDGRVFTFQIGQLDLTPPGFNAQHLTVHAATSQPVVVTYEKRDDELVAVRLVDGP
jgi:hypothetical protein